jgi:5-oxoprolinase (ATP-hydrolysing)
MTQAGNKGPAGWQFWVDRGGTFTDVVARRPDGRIDARKLLSDNPTQYDDAVVAGIRACLRAAGEGPDGDPAIDGIRVGTTVATNALLERRGEPTLLLITRGFGDALRIGYQQRPALFDRHIRLPSPLYADVVEVDERLDSAGRVIQPLDEIGLARSLEEAHASGLRSVAIVFLHGYREPRHEIMAERLARRAGFTQISASHRVGALAKLVARGDTTVVDAYLSPVLRRYVDRLQDALPDTRLLFMQSNGGLTEAGSFRGRDSILSGPAGGVVGMAATAEAAGFDHLIGFDMGGTSTDVSLYDGAFERTLDSEVAGARIQAPMMRIHTVAAGGGSVLKFLDGRFQVGPESAGADPGPACYRRGGPLTVTDANLRLGRIQPDRFPRVFGINGDQALDPTATRDAFARLARQIEDENGLRMSEEAIAEGYIRIAVERMAQAIKQISIQRGYDTGRFTLCCFGGAAGQHACAVADALGIPAVMIHPLSGVLSAYGMGLADLREIRQQAVQAPLDQANLDKLAPRFDVLEQDIRRHLGQQGVSAQPVFHRSLLIRFEGSDTLLEVPHGEAAAVAAGFDDLHERRFGFREDKPRMIEAMTLEAVVREDATGPSAWVAPGVTAPPRPESRPIYLDGCWRDTPIHQRQHLLTGVRIQGPALILEDNATILVAPHWTATADQSGNLLLRRQRESGPARDEPGIDKPDPVLLEVFNNLFMHIAEQMGVVLEKTAHSVNIKERLDFSCAVFDTLGGLVANAPHMPVHLGSMGESVRTVIRRFGERMEPGDSFVLNAPYDGGTHLPDVTVVSPFFVDGESSPLFYVAARAHHADIGGMTPGSMPPDSTRIEQEGVLIECMRLVRGGQFREQAMRAVLASGPYPARNPDQNIADLRAQLAATSRGIGELSRMLGHYGAEVVRAYMGHVQDNAEEAVRRAIGGLSSGSFRYELDSGEAIAVRIDVDRETRSAVIDFDGTSPQSASNFNAPLAVCRAAVLYVFRTLVDHDIPMNEGCMRPLSLRVPPASLLDPHPPAAVVAGNVETSQCVVDALYGALGVLAAAQGTMNNLTFGNQDYQYYETLCGGAGAGPGFDGASAVHTHMTNSRLTDPEILEWRYPVRLRRFEIRRGSGGDGRHRGGDGVRREIEFLQPMSASILSNHRRIPPFGVAGGEPGATGRNRIRRRDGRVEPVGATATLSVEAGEALIIETPGGGGYGPAGE